MPGAARASDPAIRRSGPGMRRSGPGVPAASGQRYSGVTPGRGRSVSTAGR